MLAARHALLRLDIDKGAHRPTVDELVGKLRRAGYSVVTMSERRSPGGKGWHITLDLTPRPRTMVEVVALQAICGSDAWREAVTLFRCRVARTSVQRDAANVLYKQKVARGKLFGGNTSLRMDVVDRD